MIMNRHAIPVLIIISLAALVFAESVYKFEEKEQIQKTLKFQDPAKPKALQLDNVFGGIDVQGYDGSRVELVAHKTIKAKSQDKIQKAKEEVKLDIKESGGTIDIYVDGPFRCQCENGKGLKWRDWGYEVHYDFVLKVPRQTSLTLKTVNHGDIAVKGVDGTFDINNVNGKIEMEGVAGSGEAHTVNGRVRAGFSRNPDADCSFRTVNGDVELSFREGLSADVKMKTFHGEAFSDFEVKALPASAEVKQSQEPNKTKFVYKRDRFTQVRIGKGGPAIECDTLNGDILIKKSH
jgi:DUF4097 and DUF4098 domain-containing protein YvlB